MSSQPKETTTENDIISLRDQFAERAKKAMQTARDLEAQAQKAYREAEVLNRQAQVMDQAYELIVKENALTMATAKLEDLGAKDFAKIAKRRFIFLIDGSGSMNGAPLEGSLTAAQAMAEKITAAGGAVESYMFGNKDPQKVDVTDEEQRQKIRKGLHCGTDMAPAIEMVSGTLTKVQPTHVVIFSDGDIFDKEPTKKAIVDMFAKFPKVTVDAVQVGTASPSSGYNALSSYDGDGSGRRLDVMKRSFQSYSSNRMTALQKFFAELSAETAGARSPKIVSARVDLAPALLVQILVERLQQTVAKPSAKKQQKPAAPGK